MADCVKTLQVRLQQDGFCVATGPRDSAIDYPCPVEPFAPVLLGSPVVLHVYCPDLFPGEVLKVHAEHLGHFTGIRNVPRVNDEHERALFSGLCGLFGRERVIGVYDETLVDGSLREEVKKALARIRRRRLAKVFVAFQSENRDRARQTLALLRKLTRLFDLNELRDADIPRTSATPVRRDAPEAHVPPWYESLPRKADEADQGVDPETKLQYYRLFTGYEIGNDGTCASGDSRDDLAWTGNSVQLRRGVQDRGELGQGPVVRGSAGRRQAAHDAASPPEEDGRGSGRTRRPDPILPHVRQRDGLLAVRALRHNPLHAAVARQQRVLRERDGVTGEVREQVRRRAPPSERGYVLSPQDRRRRSANCLYLSGVGFARAVRWEEPVPGKIFTGPEDKKPPPKYKTTFGDFATVTMGVSASTEMLSMLDVALALGKKDKGGGASLRAILSKGHRPAGIQRVAMDASLYARYHHRFNTGEFTEVACVKAMSDPMYNEKIHKDALTEKSEYRLCLAHGALPMCVLTLCMTMRQTVMISLGLFCTELARSVYAASKLNYGTLCARLVTMATVTKFRHKKDSDEA
ncbi:hypothetical protein Q5P01_021957 [Channa striata]|uniref:Uncharacterized protein n=1 Tax=Channa striata TaxID=64152 RepID=A0AA88LM81_CHASR|nr:hypothetical protein Q5P01_021957 [Channa striata]